MAIIITGTDLASFLNQTETPRHSFIAALLSGIVSDYLDNEDLEGVSVKTDRVFDGIARGGNVFLLPSQTVTAVAKIEVRHNQSASWAELNPDYYAWNKEGFIANNGVNDSTLRFHWPYTMKSIRITYTSGYAIMPMSIKAVTLGAAARAFSNPNSVAQESIGDYSVQYGFPTGSKAAIGALDPLELSMIQKYASWEVG